MMKTSVDNQVDLLLAAYDPAQPAITADQLQELWLQGERKSIATIKAEQREQQETVGIAVENLKTLGQALGKSARQRVGDFVPLVRLLWDSYGREGRVIATIALGMMELAEPATVMPLIKELCRSCITWEDADRLAMDALEPIVRQAPEQWLSTLEPWLSDESKWVRRTGITVMGRLPLKHRTYTAYCLTQAERLLADPDTDVKKAVSFAIRLAVRGEVVPVRDFLSRHVPPPNPAATWVLCDVIRSMGRQFLPEFVALRPLYEQWAADPALNAADRRSVESAIKVLSESV